MVFLDVVFNASLVRILAVKVAWLEHSRNKTPLNKVKMGVDHDASVPGKKSWSIAGLATVLQHAQRRAS